MSEEDGRATVARLPDGRRVRLRPVEPSDADLLRSGFEHLSEESRYRRFLAPMPELSDAMVSYLTRVDHRDHEAIVALDDVTGEGVGIARYVRDPSQRDLAEAAVTVIDDWQGRGLGTLLLEGLADRAREEGISRFTALLLATNEEMIELLESLGPIRVVDREGATLEVEIPLLTPCTTRAARPRRPGRAAPDRVPARRPP
jgi:GNAT superfamily N-acetyltransferase